MDKDIKFVTIDFWGRAIYKVLGTNIYLSSVNVIFPDKSIAPNNTTEEINDYFKTHLDELSIHGNNIDDDPLGYKLKDNVDLNIIE